MAHTGIPAHEKKAASAWLIVGIGAAVTAWGGRRVAERRQKLKNKPPQHNRPPRKTVAPAAKEDDVDRLFESTQSTVMLDDVPAENSMPNSDCTAEDRQVCMSLQTLDSRGSVTQEASKAGLAAGISRVCAMVALITLGIGGFLSLHGTRTTVDLQPAAVASQEVSETARYTSKPIQNLRAAGDRVLANNPETDGQAPGDYGTFNRESWRVLNMHMHKPDGGQLNVSLARPLTWIDAARRDDDGRLWLELAELGITGWATVESLLECPESIDGQGRLVTGTFEHTSGEVVNLFIKGEPDPIGTTAHHRFWSEDRQEFVEAQQLQVGEQLLQADGKLTTVERLVRVEDSQPVYNLEVDGEHVYYVSNSGVLVHNVCAPKSLAPGEVAFSQRTVGSNVTQYIDDMVNNRRDWSRSGPINVMKQGDRYVTFDNRRVMAARQANLSEIPINVVDPKAIRPGTKMTWEEAIRRRFTDPRNKRAGGVVPDGGLMGLPAVVVPKAK